MTAKHKQIKPFSFTRSVIYSLLWCIVPLGCYVVILEGINKMKVTEQNCFVEFERHNLLIESIRAYNTEEIKHETNKGLVYIATSLVFQLIIAALILL